MAVTIRKDGKLQTEEQREEGDYKVARKDEASDERVAELETEAVDTQEEAGN